MVGSRESTKEADVKVREPAFGVQPQELSLACGLLAAG